MSMDIMYYISNAQKVQSTIFCDERVNEKVKKRDSVENGGDFPVVITYKQYNVVEMGRFKVEG